MTDPILSLVVPIFNSEAFLEDCLVSVRDQITPECEVILVDDGSSDGSVDIIKKGFAPELEQGNFVLIEITNSGPGEARNTGVRDSRGQYIGFLDSDDLLLPGYIARCLNVLKQKEPDIVQFNLLRVLDDDLSGKHLIACHRSPDGFYDMDAVRAEIFGLGKWFAPARIFKREIILANLFPAERVFYEDLQLLPFIFFQDSTIYLIGEPLIAYRDNPHGTTRNHRPEHAKTMLSLFERLGALPPSVPRDLMRVKVARGIVFLALELKMNEFDLSALRRQIRGLENKAALTAHLGRVDRIFMRFPLLYTAVDLGRQRLRSMLP